MCPFKRKIQRERVAAIFRVGGCVFPPPLHHFTPFPFPTAVTWRKGAFESDGEKIGISANSVDLISNLLLSACKIGKSKLICQETCLHQAGAM